MATKEEIVEAILYALEQYYYYSRPHYQEDLEEYEEELKRMTKEELLAELVSIVHTVLYHDSKEDFYDTMALSAYANAVEVLEEEGLFEVDVKCGRRIIGRLTEEGKRTLKNSAF